MTVRVAAVAAVAALALAFAIAWAGQPGARPLAVQIIESRSGEVAAQTNPGATCQALVSLPTGANRPHRIADPVTAGADGLVRWHYATSPFTAGGTGSYTVTCNLGNNSANAHAEFKLDVDPD